jgi:hypothetical protein
LTLGYTIAREHLEKILLTAKKSGRIIEIDLEYRDLVQPTFMLAEEMIEKRHPFRIAIQSGLKNALGKTQRLINCAARSEGDIGFRIITGSCYKENTPGHRTTLETPEIQTIEQYYHLIEEASRWTQKGRLQSAVGTQNIDRLIYAACHGLELQFLKGEEETKAYLIGKQLQQRNYSTLTMYLGFGSIENAGVRAYLARRVS